MKETQTTTTTTTTTTTNTTVTTHGTHTAVAGGGGGGGALHRGVARVAVGCVAVAGGESLGEDTGSEMGWMRGSVEQWG